MKTLKILVICILSLALLTGCKDNPVDENDTDKENNLLGDSENTSDISDDEEIVNLPTELYYITKSTSAIEQRYDFFVKTLTDFEITVITDSGTLKFGIKDKDTGEYVYEMREFTSESDTFSLSEGQYSVILSMTDHYGSYHIVGTPTE